MRTLALAVLFMGLATVARAAAVGNAVDVEIRTDGGRTLPLYPVASSSTPRLKVYAEAVKGDHYTIVVRNRLHRRIGIVVAVDGRNIISGKNSWLRNDERMYILDPDGSGEYKGWRTGEDRVNRFYFTSAADSYAAAFNDESAMGVIAVAVYPEVCRYEEPAAFLRGGPAAPRAAGKSAAPPVKEEADRAGTGYGREEYSPVRVVEFEPEGSPLENIYIKYEWRSTLCRKGIVGCGRRIPPRNRMWDDDDWAPPPPPHG